MADSRKLAVVALAGGIGGLVNAILCYLEWPMPVEDTSVRGFQWHVIPAGFAHGCVLAAIPVVAAALGRHWKKPLRWAAGILVGWVAGYLSWIPLDLSIGEPLQRALIWPFQNGDSAASALWVPFPYFGGVAALLYLWMILERGGASVWISMLAASVAAGVGSFWWWASWGPWYFSPLHGSVWGCLVGFALASEAQGRHISRSS